MKTEYYYVSLHSEDFRNKCMNICNKPFERNYFEFFFSNSTLTMKNYLYISCFSFCSIGFKLLKTKPLERPALHKKRASTESRIHRNRKNSIPIRYPEVIPNQMSQQFKPCAAGLKVSTLDIKIKRSSRLKIKKGFVAIIF